MDKKIIDRLEDIRNRMIQAHKIFSTAAYELSVTIESLDDDFKDDLESYAKDADSFEPDRDDTIDSIITEIETTIDYISDLSEGAKWYLSEQSGESISFDEFKALALNSSPKSTELIYEIKQFGIFNSNVSSKFDVARTGMSKSFDDAKRTLWRSTSNTGRRLCGEFYEIIERPLNEIGYQDFRHWLFNEYGQMLDYAYSNDAIHLFRGFETVRFKSGEILLFINNQYKTLEPCVIVELPYTIAECWELNNRLRDECFENEEAYTKAIYEQKIEGKDCYKIYTLNGGKLIDCLPVSLIRASNPGDWSRIPMISSENYRSLKGWYDNYISKNQKHDI